jgi:hypothetical protein
LGLEGPAEELMIPNNVKQELKLWESYHRNKVSMETGFNYADEPIEEYDYYTKPWLTILSIITSKQSNYLKNHSALCPNAELAEGRKGNL